MDLHLLKYGKKVEKRFQGDFTKKKGTLGLLES